MTTSPSGISFHVDGWPPTKNEATSLLAAGSSQATRVRALLQAAEHAATICGWVTTDADVSLDLVVRGPGQPPADATNYLGGISDVLQDKIVGRNLDVAHLGELAAVALYRDDRQIRHIEYGERAPNQPSYTVRIHHLSPPTAAPAASTPPDAALEETPTERGRRVVAALAAKGAELVSSSSRSTRYRAAG
ncbi:hypothetical protein Val02_85390 [Virgisporangium aliadipatigenens]|uniref:Uncharacterized protein n=1 Tax=Virgisporangium aliadipatigenens TaxID=741659 RepID=A0A8J3YY15_9ACTN|nr:hypothetical protein [Virgisporangium aliadipatigenens]GIJ51653.1 hypothetical protein Val02_85390 [Virgisporangium aliadipatigenens]